MAIEAASERPQEFFRVSATGLLVASVFFLFSLTPSMVPRPPELQGALGGVIAGIGYLLWWGTAATLAWFGLSWRARRPPVLDRVLWGAAVLVVAVALWNAGDWQNSIHRAWGMPPVERSAPFRILLVGTPVFVFTLGFGWLFRVLKQRWQRRFKRVLPARLAALVGLAMTMAIFVVVIDGVAVRGVLRGLDHSAKLTDALIVPELAPPTSPLVSGGPGSALEWQDLGRWGRSFVASGPTADAIAEFWKSPAKTPIRVYVGLNAADTPEARARLAFEELVRLGGFDRAVLVIAMPTGSGWLDPGGVDTLEYITRGDVATVSVQYSYLPSHVSVVVDRTHGVAESQALFDIVYRHWTTLPRDARPRLFLHGLSLGAFLSQETLPLLNLYADPIDGALWTGSPYLSELWRTVQSQRHRDSPAWRPRFGDGSLIRTMSQDGGLERFDADWGPMRFVFLQYGSDPIVFFDNALAWRRPAWLNGERAPDLSPQMRWIPVVTFCQVGLDMAIALGELGYGHDYAARHYIPAWAETLAPEGWTADDEARLVAHLAALVPR
jgi:uncharacterized membrane protein